MTTTLDIKTIILLILLTLGLFRFIKKLLHIFILVGPPLLLSISSYFPFLPTFIVWFCLTDFLIHNLRNIYNLLSTLFIPKNTFRCGLIGKLLNICLRIYSLFLITNQYFQFTEKLLNSNGFSDIVNYSIYTFIFISVVNLATSFLLKRNLFKLKKIKSN